MARARRRAYALALTLAAMLAGGPAAAQHLPVLHVVTLGMHADRASVRPGEAFHVTVRVHVRERGVAIAPLLILPTLDNLDDLGDERHTISAPGGGTDFVEVLTLAARTPGEAALSPAYFDAIDAGTGKPSRFSSQPLRIRVAGAAPARGPALVDVAVRIAVTIAAIFGALAVAAVGLVIIVRRRKRPRLRAEISAGFDIAPVATAPPTSARDRLGAALATFEACSGEMQRVALRAALIERAGAPDGATLTDALAGARDARLRSALIAAERATFGRPSERPAADRDLIDGVRALLDDAEAPAWTP